MMRGLTGNDDAFNSFSQADSEERSHSYGGGGLGALKTIFWFGVFCQFCITHLDREYKFETAMVLQSDLLLCKMPLIAGWLKKFLVGLGLCPNISL